MITIDRDRQTVKMTYEDLRWFLKWLSGMNEEVEYQGDMEELLECYLDRCHEKQFSDTSRGLEGL